MDKERLGSLDLPCNIELAEGIVIPQGNLNRMIPVRWGKELYLLRLPKTAVEIRPTQEALAAEYAGLGFTELGGKYRFRTLTEQVGFSQRCQALGLSLTVLERVDGLTLIRYQPGMRLSHYNRFPEAEPEVTLEFLDSVVAAHRQGVIWGDRWTPNALVTPTGGIVQIDLDIELSSPVAREFELAQAMHYGSQSANRTVAKAVRLWWSSMSGLGGYDRELVNFFLEQHRRYGETHPTMNPYPLVLQGGE